MAKNIDPAGAAEGARGRMAEARETIAGSLAALAGEVQEVTDIRAWVRREPWLFVGGAAVVGFLLSQKPRAVGAILARLLPAVAMAAAKPMLEQVGRDLGQTLGSKVRV